MEQTLFSEADLEFCESWFTPKCLLESLFHDFDNLADYKLDKFGEVRLYQQALLSDEAIIDFEATSEYHGLNRKQTFQLRKNVGTIFCFGARKFGKTLCVELLDLVLNMLTTLFGMKVAFASVDLIHIRAVLDNVKTCFQNHPLCKLWERRITGAPDYFLQLKTGYKVNSVNFNIGSKNPGRQWYGKHVDRVYIEEGSLETEEVEKKRQDALSEFGAIFRCSGMTDFSRYSPAGKIFHGETFKKWVLNLPQYVNPNWGEREKAERIEQYGGEDAINYRVFVKGEVVEDAHSVFDMQRIADNCYITNKNGDFTEQIKRFEITKETYPYFRNLIIVERPENADRIFINSDIGEKVTEITIHSELGDKYKYLYNIVLYNLTHLEQLEVFKFLARKTNMNVLGLDCGDGMGRAIYRELETIFPKDNLVWYDGSKKLEVGFETDDDGKVIMEKGKPVIHEEYMSEWSVKRMQDLFYSGRVLIPDDPKLRTQISAVISMKSGNRMIYKCLTDSGDHAFDNWKVFAIAQWLKKDFNKTKPVKLNWGTGVSGWKKK
jgi:hypothetical protein